MSLLNTPDGVKFGTHLPVGGRLLLMPPSKPRRDLEMKAIEDALYQLALERMIYITANRERLVEAWLAETGLLPSECVIVEQVIHDTTTVWIERRPPFNDCGAGI